MPWNGRTPLEELYEQYYQTYYSKLWRQALQILRQYQGTGDPGRAEEAVQETFLIAWEKPKAFLDSPSPEGWLVNTLKNVLRNMIREDQRWTARLQAIQDKLTQDGAHSVPGIELELEGLLPPEEWEILKRFYLEGETDETLCRELGVKKSTLAMRIKKIKETFRKNYREAEKFFEAPVELLEDSEHYQNRGGSKV